jgi:dethiobiotin synthetase
MLARRGYFVTGTDTDVGKTVVTAALARALREGGARVTTIKVVQTGAGAMEGGDAARAGRLAGCKGTELVRFAAPADPWAAALAEGARPPRVADLVARIAAVPGAIVVEGSGGIAVPLNASETFVDLAEAVGLPVVVAVGLRLGCINHAALTVEACERRGIRVAGCVLVERWQAVAGTYRRDVARALQDKTHIFGILPFASEADAVASGAALFANM